ncbi:MAG: peptidylprolyl isomerase [Candidatus Micrarchaeota archaeon]|nr:peptidylprolyl isomerase [Candidatus Micrarchaeota archaeon]
MAFKDGDFLEVEYSAWTAPENTLISTTDEKMAKDSGLYEEHVKYGPVLVIIGSSGVIKGLDTALRGMSAGEQKKMTFKPDEAFGERSEGLIRVMPIAEFRKRDVEPYPGMRVDLDNFTATVKSVNSGRVVVDANHPYAGRDITYEVKVVKNLTDEKEKINALGKMAGIEVTKVDASGKDVKVSFNNAVKKNADYFMGKANLVASIFTYFHNIDKVNVDEEYIRPPELKEQKKQ